MRAAVPLGDIVRVAEHALLVGVVPLHCHLDDYAIPFRLEIEGRRVNRRLVPIQVLDESADTAFILKHILLSIALVLEFDAHSGIEER